MRLFLLFTASFLLFLLSCKKEARDQIKPVIEILSPSIGKSFETGDTIEIRVKVTDNIALKSLILNVYDNNGVRHAAEVIVGCSGNEIVLTEKLILDNDYSEGLTYDLSARIFDEEGNFGTDNQSINISRRRLNLSGFIFDCSHASGAPLVFVDATTGTNIPFASAESPSGAITFQEYYQRIICIPKGSNGPAKSMNEAGVTQWSLQSLSGQPFSYAACAAFEDKVFIHRHDGTLLQVGLSGTIELSNLYNSEYFGVSIGANRNYTLSQMQFRSNDSRKLVLHDRANLQPVFEMSFNDSIVEINASTDGAFFYILSAAKLQRFDPVTKTLTLMFSHPEIGGDFAELKGMIVLSTSESFGIYNVATGLFNAAAFNIMPLPGNCSIVTELSNQSVYVCGTNMMGRYNLSSNNTVTSVLPLQNTTGLKGFALLMKP